MPEEDRAEGLISELSPATRGRASSLRLALLALSSRYYPLPEIIRSYRSYHYSRALLDPQLHGYDLRRSVPRLDVPVYFFVGRGDTTFGVTLQQAFYRALVDLRGKRFVLFGASTHWPHLEEPAKFQAEMERVRAATDPAFHAPDHE